MSDRVPDWVYMAEVPPTDDDPDPLLGSGLSVIPDPDEWADDDDRDRIWHAILLNDRREVAAGVRVAGDAGLVTIRRAQAEAILTILSAASGGNALGPTGQQLAAQMAEKVRAALEPKR